MQSKAVRGVVAVVIAVVVFLFVNAAITAFTGYNPKAQEQALLVGEAQQSKISADKIKILTFNTGHGALGEESDSKKEGGKGGRASADVVLKNVRGIAEIVNLSNADAVLLQDVDVDCHRSRYVDQLSYYITNGAYTGAFATDFKVRSTSLLPPYKKVNSGLLTLSCKKVLSATRVSLPQGYSGLSGALNPKSAMLVTEFEIGDSDKKLVLINFEVDAYISDERRLAQIEAVVDFAEKAAQNGDYVIAGGSFYCSLDDTASRYPLNDRNRWEPGNFSFESLKNGWNLVYDSAVATARILDKPFDSSLTQEERQVYLCDGYIVSPNIDVKMIVTVDQQFRYSYHNPVLLEISLK